MTDTLDGWGGDVPTLLHALRWGFDYESIVYRLHHDPQFALEMRVCKEWRIPHSEFLSWEPEDQSKALAFYVYEAQRCASCGVHPEDWPDHNEPVYEAEAHFCPGCAELERFKRWLHDKTEKAPASASDGITATLKKTGR